MDKNQIHMFYDANYYSSFIPGLPYERNERWLNFFDNVAKHIVEEIKPKTVLDAGCALGFLVEALRKRGVQAFGVDISEYAIQNVHPDIREFCWVGSIAEAFPQKYDLIVSIEVIEHLPIPEAERAIENFCQHSDQVLFSSTPDEYKEATHVNVQPVEHWGELFARRGLYRDLDHDASYICPWAGYYLRREVSIERLVREYERKFFRLWDENVELRRAVIKSRNELDSKGQALKNCQNELSLIENSRSWKLIQKIRRTGLLSPITRRK